MGRYPKVSDDAFLDIMESCDEVSQIQKNIEDTWNKIKDLKEQAQLAQVTIYEKKKELAKKHGVSVSYINQLNNITTKRARILKNRKIV